MISLISLLGSLTMSGITEKSLNAFYYACSHAKVDYSRFMNVTAAMALHTVSQGNCQVDNPLFPPYRDTKHKADKTMPVEVRLSIETDFTLSEEKVGDYYIGVRQVLTNLFGQREVLAYVTASDKATSISIPLLLRTM